MKLITIISWVLTTLSIIGVLLLAYKRKECFYFFIPSSLGWIVYYFYMDQVSSSVLFFVYTFFNFLGIYQWNKKEKEERELKIVKGKDAERFMERMEDTNRSENKLSEEKYEQMIQDAKELGIKL